MPSLSTPAFQAHSINRQRVHVSMPLTWTLPPARFDVLHLRTTLSLFKIGLGSVFFFLIVSSSSSAGRKRTVAIPLYTQSSPPFRPYNFARPTYGIRRFLFFPETGLS